MDQSIFISSLKAKANMVLKSLGFPTKGNLLKVYLMVKGKKPPKNTNLKELIKKGIKSKAE